MSTKQTSESFLGKLDWARLLRADFRFGALNLLILVVIMAAGAAIEIARGDLDRHLAIELQIVAVAAALVMSSFLIMRPCWEKAIGLGLVYWILLTLVYRNQDLPITNAAAWVGLFVATCIQIARQWEKGVVLRLGKFRCLKGPGVFFILPLLDRVDRYVDHRVRATDFRAETTLTRDTVPVNVDAIAFWLVWDAKMSVLEVEDFVQAVILSAQTALRDAIGKHDLAEMLSDRERLGQEIQAVLDRKTDPWGITIQTIEIRDIIIPKALEDAMSRQAQAERERQSRVILGTAETEIAEKFAAASEAYRDNPVALHLRAMNMVFEGLKQKGSMIIVPSTAVETMGLGALGGLTAFDRQTGAGLPVATTGEGSETTTDQD
jgi:regulator of protease activity HflC (stomatin/prohibitin superfamily)